MSNVAIIIGNSAYRRQTDLPCCSADVDAISRLLTATSKFEHILAIKDATSDEMREALRQELDRVGSVEEAFFYFSGHGTQIRSDFFFCGTDFDENRPHETGLPNGELHGLLRAYSPALVVKVIDACNSGTTLIKADAPVIADGKGVLSNVVQFASCQSSQYSLTGNPLSLFTEHFCLAASRERSGPVYYSDIINTLRDDFLDDDEHTPHFVSQGTGREEFANDASLLQDFRKTLVSDESVEATAEIEVSPATAPSQSLVDLMRKADAELATPKLAEAYISGLFDKLKFLLKEGFLSEFYNLSVVEHSDYDEPTARPFIIRSLARESRMDRFVTAAVTREKKKNYLGSLASIALALGDDYTESFSLTLNCTLSRVQIVFTLEPKFKVLDQIRLVVSCAPSLSSCYIFEISTRHMRSDWEKFDDLGAEIDRNWYERKWTEDNSWLADEICGRIRIATQRHVDRAVKRLHQLDEANETGS